ncbi:MAG: AmmeMemoRadiSam system radical SAM enzyme [Candidatus Pacearchaeota archaeon]
MKEALFYKKLKNKIVKCELCPNFCIIADGKTGKCRVRKNFNGKLFSLVYGKPCSIAIDPIEKKPLYHFFPGNKTLSIATFGCNLFCLHCQNYEISHEFSNADISEISFIEPEKIVEEAENRNIKIISYTYTEPTIFYEYMLDISKIAKKKKIKNVIVSNGYINIKPLKKLINYIHAANIDLKAMKEEFYKKICNGKLEPVLETIKFLVRNNIWTEITNLVIPTLNDKEEDIDKIIDFVYKLGKFVPLHFTAFFPAYKLLNLSPTPENILIKARKKAIDKGLYYVYAGNILNLETNSTYCHKCKSLLIKRIGFNVVENNIKNGKCFNCKTKIYGVWD